MIETLEAGSNYTLRLFPEQPLTACQIRQATQLLRDRQAEIQEQFGIQVTSVKIQPDSINLNLYSGLTIQVEPFLYFLVTVFGVLGIAVVAYLIVAALAASPWVWLFGITGIAFGAYVVYTWNQRTRRR